MLVANGQRSQDPTTKPEGCKGENVNRKFQFPKSLKRQWPRDQENYRVGYVGRASYHETRLIFSNSSLKEFTVNFCTGEGLSPL
jgi:hypothetical protein